MSFHRLVQAPRPSPPTAKTRRPFVTLLLTVANRGVARALCGLRFSTVPTINLKPDYISTALYWPSIGQITYLPTKFNTLQRSTELHGACFRLVTATFVLRPSPWRRRRRGTQNQAIAPHPCNLADAIGDSSRPAVAGGRPAHPGAEKPVAQRGSPSAVPLNPNSRLGRKASPVAQGRVKMDAIVVGIDVSKDKLDIAVRPSGAVFSTSRDAAGLDAVIGLSACATRRGAF